MKLTPEELAALPDRVREALASGSVTLEEPVKEWEPEHGGYFAGLAGNSCLTPNRPVSDVKLYRNQGILRSTEQQAELLLKDRQGYCLQHAYRAQYAPDYVEPDIGKVACFVGFVAEGPEVIRAADYRPLNAITMPEWLCHQLVADIKSGRYKL